MGVEPFQRSGLSGIVAAMAVDEENAPKPGLVQITRE
jgi:hypothetical protein